MIYIINEFNDLVIYNDSDKTIFMMNKFNKWVKRDFDQYGTKIYINSNYSVFFN